MKILFLDIDGVLATPKSYKTIRHIKASPTENNPMPEDKEYNSFDPKAVAHLNHILEKTDAILVMSSTWRKLSSFMELKVILKQEGVKGKLLDITGDHYRGRGHEVKDWLEKNSSIVDKYVIVDDDIQDILEHHPKNTVHVMGGWLGGHGMLRKHAVRATEILGETNG